MSVSGTGAPPRVSARTLQIALGLLWLLDGMLQLQPNLFGMAFATNVILPSAQNQPGLLSGAITHVAHLVAVQPAVVNALFAAVQILIGVGLLIRDTVKPALVVSFVWGLGVWTLGEGVGMLFTGSASPFSGAPGAALLYVVVGLVVWPRVRVPGTPAPRGPAAAEGLLGERGGKAVWALLWIGMGALWLLPVNRAPGAIAGMMSGAAMGEPGWLSHLEMRASGIFSGGGTSIAVAAALVSVAIGLGPLLTKHTSLFLVAGIALSLDYWVFGQAFGQIFTGNGTDPSTAPVVVLLAFTLFPNRARALATPSSGAFSPETPARFAEVGTQGPKILERVGSFGSR